MRRKRRTAAGEPAVRAYNDSVFDHYGNNKQAGFMKRRDHKIKYVGFIVDPYEQVVGQQIVRNQHLYAVSSPEREEEIEPCQGMKA